MSSEPASANESNRMRGYLIYDGDCTFCQKWVVRLQKIGYADWIEVKPYQSSEEILKHWGLSQDDTTRAMYVVTEECHDGRDSIAGSKKTYRGAAGANFLLRTNSRNPLWRLLGYMYLIPGIKQFEDLGYYIIARNRHKLGCGGDACTLPSAKK